MKNAKISRRSFLLGLAACSAAGILTACKGDDTPASSASTSPEAPASSVSELEPIGLFTVEDFPKLDGSTACIPLMAQMMADTTGIDLEVAQSGISVSTTAYAWENFGLYPDEEYTARMLVVYEAPDYVKEELKEANAQLEQKPIGRDALVFIVNENNPVKSLTRQQLKDIYAGKITNWKEVGGEDLAIVPFQRGEDSGSQTLFRKLLIQGSELMDFNGRHVVITGASTGIGRASAARVAALGGRVTLIARRAELLAAACAELGPGAPRAAADVGDGFFQQHLGRCSHEHALGLFGGIAEGHTVQVCLAREEDMLGEVHALARSEGRQRDDGSRNGGGGPKPEEQGKGKKPPRVGPLRNKQK